MALAGFESVTGTTVEVFAGEPATQTAAGFKALASAQIVGLVNFGEWGDMQNDITEALVSEGRLIHANGISDGGEVAIAVQHREIDAGRDIIVANQGTSNLVSVIKTYSSGDVECAIGVISGERQRAVENDAIRGFSCMLRVNTQLFKFTQAEWAAA